MPINGTGGQAHSPPLSPRRHSVPSAPSPAARPPRRPHPCVARPACGRSRSPPRCRPGGCSVQGAASGPPSARFSGRRRLPSLPPTAGTATMGVPGIAGRDRKSGRRNGGGSGRVRKARIRNSDFWDPALLPTSIASRRTGRGAGGGRSGEASGNRMGREDASASRSSGAWELGGGGGGDNRPFGPEGGERLRDSRRSAGGGPDRRVVEGPAVFDDLMTNGAEGAVGTREGPARDVAQESATDAGRTKNRGREVSCVCSGLRTNRRGGKR
ncbi:hypothetical protein ACHAWF_009670 [Thalassiosira exigua]